MLIRAPPSPGSHRPISENGGEDSRIFEPVCGVPSHCAVDRLGHISGHMGGNIPQRTGLQSVDDRKRTMEVDSRRELVGRPSRQKPVCTGTERVNIAPYAGRGRPPIRGDLGGRYRWSSHEWGYRTRSRRKKAGTPEIGNHALALGVKKEVRWL